VGYLTPEELVAKLNEKAATSAPARDTGPLMPESTHEPPGRNPPWTTDELILALDLYLRNRLSPPGKSSPEVQGLSDVLNALSGRPSHRKFRNPSGVVMKMMNFRRFDPGRAKGRVGLTHGNRLEDEVWREFSGDTVRLRQVAEAIRQSAKAGTPTLPDDDEEIEAAEGRVLTRAHISRERNRALVEKRKAKAGALLCEACGFSFERRYGERGKGFIECHHTKPLHTLTDGSRTRLSDLALVCSNCHRMIHAQRPWLTVEGLRAILKAVDRA